MSGLITVRDVAAFLNVSQRTVERLSRTGLLPRYRIGPRLVRYREADVQAALGKLRVGKIGGGL